MFCKHCGKQLTDGAKFCPDCGTPVSAKAQHMQHTEDTPLHRQSTHDESAHSASHSHAHPAHAAKTAPHNHAHQPQTAQPNHAHHAQAVNTANASGSHAQAGAMNYTASDMATAPAPKVRRNFTIGNIVTWIGCFLAFISMFMTFATVSILGFSQTVTLFDTNDGKLFLAVILAVAVINFFRIDIISLIGSCVGVFFLFMEYKDAADKLQQFSSMVHYGIGRMLLTVGIILMVLGAVASIFLRKKNVKLNVLQ